MKMHCALHVNKISYHSTTHQLDGSSVLAICEDIKKWQVEYGQEPKSMCTKELHQTSENHNHPRAVKKINNF